MKLIRFGEPGKEKPGVFLNDGARVDASGFGSDYDEAFFGNGGLAALRQWVGRNSSAAPRVAPSIRFGPPVFRPRQNLCLGPNFPGPPAANRIGIPHEPVDFLKATTSRAGPDD